MSVTWNRSVVSSTNKTDPHDVIDILLKVVLNTINQTMKTFVTCSVKVVWNLNLDDTPSDRSSIFNVVFINYYILCSFHLETPYDCYWSKGWHVTSKLKLHLSMKCTTVQPLSFRELFLDLMTTNNNTLKWGTLKQIIISVVFNIIM